MSELLTELQDLFRWRAPSAEAKAKGKPLTKAVVHEFGQAVLEDINPRDSWRASKAFRQHIATVLAERALTESNQIGRR